MIRKFLEVTIRGYEYAYDNIEESVDITLKYNPDVDLEYEIGTMKFFKDYLVNWDQLGPSDLAVWTSTHDTLVEYEVIENPIEDLNEVFTNEFLP